MFEIAVDIIISLVVVGLSVFLTKLRSSNTN